MRRSGAQDDLFLWFALHVVRRIMVPAIRRKRGFMIRARAIAVFRSVVPGFSLLIPAAPAQTAAAAAINGVYSGN